MKKLLPLIVVGIFILSGFGAVAQNNDIEKFDSEIIEQKNIGGRENAYTHTILGEYGTATWCGYCKYAHGALKNIYAGGWHPFYYVSLVDDMNVHAAARNDEMGISGFPTVWFDGGYSTVVGAGSVESAQAAYNSSIVTCGNRAVPDIDISLGIKWQGPGNPSPEDGDTNAPIDECLIWTDAEMKISVSIDNNEGGPYNGHLRVYVTEVISSMGWYDTGGYLYTFPFLDYAFNEDISISAYQTWDDDTYWDGKDHNDGHGDDFSGITQDNTMVIAAVFNDNNDYVDETAGLLAGVNTDPKTYDVYFGESSPPPLVSSNQSDLEYCPSGELEFSTTYYWMIDVWDALGNVIKGDVWSFTTRGNDPPNTPSNPDPEDEATDVPINSCISWTSEDPDGDEVTYDVYFGKSSPPPLVSSKQSSISYCPGESLDYETEYYWKIVAWDVFEYSSTGPIWTFTTEENFPPYIPSDPNPADGATDVSIEELFKWTGGDPNPGDTVTYDVYFGKSSPPPLVDEDLSQSAYDPGTMDLDTTYYWQIVAEDNNGLTTNGPIWHFTTEKEINEPPSAPVIDGPSEGSPSEELCWTFQSDDPNDNNQIKYIIRWGDGTSDETDYYPENTPVEVCHTFEKGDYIIEASSEDQKGLVSEKSTFKVKITTPRFRTAYHPLLLRLFERFPNVFLIFQQLLELLR